MTDESNARPGVRLSAIPDALTKVTEDMTGRAFMSFDGMERLGHWARAYFAVHYGEDASYEKYVHCLPRKAFARFSFDELSKTFFSAGYMTDELRRQYDPCPNSPFTPHMLIEKIRLSIWRWGCGHRDWNEVVDGWNGIRSFDLGVPGFEVELDYTPWHHRRGVGVHSETYLDGCFAYVVRWKGEHVLTLGFSLARDRRLLVQQIQTKTRKGNRWMFRFPANRVEHILSRFAAAFPNHSLHIVDGASVAEANLRSYAATIKSDLEAERKYRAWAKTTDSAASRADYLKEARKLRARRPGLRDKVAFLKSDLPRLEAMYAQTGGFARIDSYTSNDLVHHQVERRAEAQPLPLAA
jgi:hypothetical protein